MQTFIYNRELGNRCKYGTETNLCKNLYSSIKCVRSWNPSETSDHTHHGGIFNFDFSVDGNLLVAACERKSVLVFDPFNGSLVACKNNAHVDCVNCVRFLDSRTFATCSDDTTVCLWDTRYLKQPYRTLRGHSNWVKNIEYARNQGILVTSGFDGSIYTWNINQYSDQGVDYQRVFHTNGLMRSKLTPDASKLVIATAGGYLMVVHNLNLSSLAEDLQGFKPNMYRLMQMSQSPIRQGYNYNYMFSRHQNRVEFISDFPTRDEAEMIASLEVHPQGWCVVSRNVSSDENSEWTCVHDIQDYADPSASYNPSSFSKSSSPNLTVPPEDLESPPPKLNSQLHLQRQQSSSSQEINIASSSPNPNVSSSSSTSPSIPTTVTVPSTSGGDVFTASYYISISGQGGGQGGGNPQPRIVITNADGDASTSRGSSSAATAGGGASRTRQTFELRYSGSTPSGLSSISNSNSSQTSSRGTSGSNNSNAATSNNSSIGSSRIGDNADREDLEDTRLEQEQAHSGQSSSTESEEEEEEEENDTNTDSNREGVLRLGESLSNSVTFIIRSGSQERTLLLMGRNRKRPNPDTPDIKINKNRPRLTHYVEESNVGRGFIKEVCFSNDGRLICSPFGFGVRLLAFDSLCSELCDNIPGQPLQLHELTSNMSHANTVVTTKFSPTHNLLVSGCLNGKVDFHQPIF